MLLVLPYNKGHPDQLRSKINNWTKRSVELIWVQTICKDRNGRQNMPLAEEELRLHLLKFAANVIVTNQFEN